MYLENGKGGRRGRIPKGVFSSNTAYTLVYKRKVNYFETVKKTNVKKFNHSTLNHVVDLQNPSVTLIRDSINIPIKGKRLLKENLEADIQVFEKKTKMDLDYSKAENRSFDKENASNRSYELDNVYDTIEPVNNIILETKKEPEKKIDFMMMSCNQRDAYEDVCIIRFLY